MGIFGLMTVKAHEAIAEANKGLLRDIIAERAKTKRLEALVECRDAEIAALRPDAEAMRAKRKRDREQKAAKKVAA